MNDNSGRRALFSDGEQGGRGKRSRIEEEGAPPAPGRHAFFSPGATPEQHRLSRQGNGADRTSRGRLTSIPGDRESEEEMTPPGGAVVVECKTCRQKSVMTITEVARALIVSLWIPLGRFNRLMRCPACRQIGWCRVDWTGVNPLK